MLAGSEPRLCYPKDGEALPGTRSQPRRGGLCLWALERPDSHVAPTLDLSSGLCVPVNPCWAQSVPMSTEFHGDCVGVGLGGTSPLRSTRQASAPARLPAQPGPLLRRERS
ncbi:unnamed protein product [Rangifer tarandus platyrhynchus]|uniref:Uncharacterized protein n=1 Tax=Rangifer tarandus platyrhynchus TaxID=3082113 RepID=A0AC59ZL88_RANTA